MRYVKPKKHLGQHFLKDNSTAERIVAAFLKNGMDNPVLEIGPGTGVLTTLLLSQLNTPFKVVELDKESVAFLLEELNVNKSQVMADDFLKTDFKEIF
ncbi:MAG: rRNA adenine N-6-methyltransferase family protein, partial [Bacteroidota bacterium]